MWPDIDLIFLQKHNVGYSLEAPQWNATNEYPQYMFE